jgi:uncharacterized protein YaaN involved in tellurite resistance
MLGQKQESFKFEIKAVVRNIHGEPVGYKEFGSDSADKIADFYNNVNARIKGKKKRKDLGAALTHVNTYIKDVEKYSEELIQQRDNNVEQGK